MLIPVSANLSLEDQQWLLSLLTEHGQSHLFAHAKTGDDFRSLLTQLREADAVLAPGGLGAYISRAKKLLLDSKAGVNPLAGCEVSVPSGLVLDPATPAYEELESLGEADAAGLCFVLVAGGLGERLGFPGIKIALPVETQTGTCYMDLFAQSILEFQRLGRLNSSSPNLLLPLAIMTSMDTHQRTLDLLEAHDYFGLARSQVTLMMQGKVPCLIDSEARIAVTANNRIEMKPHGHGDVHGLLLQTGLAEQWKSEGRKWLFFFQDTNSLAFRPLCACIGASKQLGLSMNSFSVPRAPGEASGGICRLRYPNGRELTCSIEYNLLGPLLQGGDVAGPDGNSPYPGNCNILLFELGVYTDVLVKKKGVVPEFVNPKYADASKLAFKAPTRLECLMQDFALLLESSPVGFCAMPRWLTFSVVKNSAEDALTKLQARQPPDCAFSGESEFFDANCRFLELAGNVTGTREKREFEFLKLRLSVGPRVTLLPSFGVTLRAVREKLKGEIRLRGGPSCSLVLAGTKAVLENVEIEGSLIVNDMQIRNKKITNSGWPMVAEFPKDQPAIAIRGFTVSGERRVLGQ